VSEKSQDPWAAELEWLRTHSPEEVATEMLKCYRELQARPVQDLLSPDNALLKHLRERGSR